MTRLTDIENFYELLSELTTCLGGMRKLSNLQEYKDWPDRGVYFFFEQAEDRTDSGNDPRVVRIGTHALTTGSRSTLRQRLAQHRGNNQGGGNHRGSIFRLLIGQALITRDASRRCESWGVKGDLGKAARALGSSREDIRERERSIEQAVSHTIRKMPFHWLPVNDEAGSGSLRGYVERNSISLLSNHDKNPIDPPSQQWLGHHSNRNLVVSSGLWNQRHVNEQYDPGFLSEFRKIIRALTHG